MALFALSEASGRDYREPIYRGLQMDCCTQ